MRVLQKYINQEIMKAVGFVLLALLVLTSFFDLMAELPSVNKNGYTLQRALLYVLFNLPSNSYDFLPIAVLIGTIFVLAQMAVNSEFTILRAASLDAMRALKILLKASLVFVIFTFLLSEFVIPISAKQAKSIKNAAMNAAISQGFKSGLWTKDVIRSHGLQGDIIGTRFINVKEITSSKDMKGISFYEFDTQFQLTQQIQAAQADYMGKHVWKLSEGILIQYPQKLGEGDEVQYHQFAQTPFAQREWVSEITPDILSVLFIDPERMSAYELSSYVKHLSENKQATGRYDMAFWKKMAYPISIMVMMILALPFAYMRARDGGISLRIFGGIMLGMVFYLVNSLFSHLGLIHTWSSFMTAFFPSFLFTVLALLSLRYVERH